MIVTTQRRAPNHLQALQVSSLLTARWYRMGRPEATMYEPETIIRLLNKAKVKFVLMGTHGLVGWRSEPRATHDVGVLTAWKDYAKAVRALHKAFPELEMIDTGVMTRFKDEITGNIVIDVMKPLDDLFRSVFRCSVAVGKTHRVPDLEMALAAKFAAMISPRRSQEKKLLDGNDFINVTRHNYRKIKRAKLQRLADKVYAGGGNEVLKMIDDVHAGREIKI
jgi:hypothetical protein